MLSEWRVVLKSPKISLTKGCFGDLTATVPTLGTFGVQPVQRYPEPPKEKHEKCHYHTHFCVPQMLVKTRT